MEELVPEIKEFPKRYPKTYSWLERVMEIPVMDETNFMSNCLLEEMWGSIEKSFSPKL